MKFQVTQITILSSQAGKGIKIGDNIIGCAAIANIAIEEGKTLEDCAREGMTLGYYLQTPTAEEGVTAGPQLVLNKEILNDGQRCMANNYVLFIADSNGDTSVIQNTLDLTRAFGLPDEDAEMMDKYLGKLAAQRGLELVRYTDLVSGTESIFFVNQFDREITDALLLGEDGDAMASYNAMLGNPEYRSELQTHNFIKMFVMSVVQAGQGRYNKLHRDDVLDEVAKTLSTITYWEDGVLYKPSVKDINGYMDEIGGKIRIG